MKLVDWAVGLKYTQVLKNTPQWNHAEFIQSFHVLPVILPDDTKKVITFEVVYIPRKNRNNKQMILLWFYEQIMVIVIRNSLLLSAFLKKFPLELPIYLLELPIFVRLHT